MKREELIKNCRYYKGEETNPFEKNPLDWFWDMERVYVNNGGIAGGEADYYRRLDGKIFPGIPVNLLTTMFTSWGKFAYDLKKELPNFHTLIDKYLDVASEHYAKDKLPVEGARN